MRKLIFLIVIAVKYKDCRYLFDYHVSYNCVFCVIVTTWSIFFSITAKAVPIDLSYFSILYSLIKNNYMCAYLSLKSGKIHENYMYAQSNETMID